MSLHTQTLVKLNQPVHEWSTLLIHILLLKINKGFRREWKSKRSNTEEFLTLTEFIKFLNSRSTFLETGE